MLRQKLSNFLNNKKEYLIIVAIASGLYPLLHYYNSNLSLINSVEQFIFLMIVFIVAPILIFGICTHSYFKKNKFVKQYNRFLIPFLNLGIFAILIVINLYGLKKKIMVLALIISFILAILLYKHIKKIIIFQYLIAFLTLFSLLPKIYYSQSYSLDWIEQPDDIEEVKFIKRPNIYLIQPDGYTNFSELKKGFYNYDNSEFENYLKNNDFKVYNDFRSNYYSTLSSNSSLFTMKHHYYYKPKSQKNELFGTRKIIVGENPVISILKNNNYKTSLIVEAGNLLANRPKLNYDYCNIPFEDVPFLPSEMGPIRDVNLDLKAAIVNNTETSNFYFIERLLPSHIQTYKSKSKGRIIERELYLKRLVDANEWLKSIINLINENDNNALIIMLADHGGFVGMNYTKEAKIKQNDRDLVYSVFSSALAIKWPEKAPEYDDKLKTSVNLFRLLFSYLSEDEKYITNFQDDKSYLMIDKGAPFGVYECIDEKGNVVFNKVNN